MLLTRLKFFMASAVASHSFASCSFGNNEPLFRLLSIAVTVEACDATKAAQMI